MAIIGTLSVVRDQLTALPGLSQALDYVERCLTPGTVEHARARGVPVGETTRVELAEGAFALEQAYLPKPREEGRWEAHSAYIDVQVILEGAERMEWMDVARLTVAEDLRPEKDLMFFAPAEGGSVLEAGTGFVAVFFPADAHKPSLAAGAGDPRPVYKTVVKLPVPGGAAASRV